MPNLLSESHKRKKRVKILKQIEQFTGSKTIVYFCGDQPSLPSQISGDVISSMYEHLLKTGVTEKISLYLYSRGGSIEVPWRIIAMVREFCKELEIIIPYKAYSATTLIALGGDRIIMGRKGELGPIDPTLKLNPNINPTIPEEIGVEDVSSYISFIKEKAGLTDQDAVSEQIKVLSEKITPVVLGQIHRTYSHIRLVAKKMLSSHQKPLSEPEIADIIENLTEKTYFHGHSIGRKEAKQMGLPIIEPKEDLEKAIWQLYKEYEEAFGLNDTYDLFSYFLHEDDDEWSSPDVSLAIVESVNELHSFQGKLKFKKKRKIPQQLSLNLNVPLQLPAGVQPQQLPANIQQLLQQIVQQAIPQLQSQIQEEIRRASPVEGIERRLEGAKWIKLY